MRLPPVRVFLIFGITRSSLSPALGGALSKEVFYIWTELDVTCEIDCL